ncbi:MAG: hypothetical protein WCF67_06650 [Chitinophagaceae bacterium]
MKKILFSIALMFIAVSTLQAQNVDLSPEKVQEFLCKKWEVEYAMMGDVKVDRTAGATEMYCEFRKDKTFTMSGDVGGNDKFNGTWNFDAKKKRIDLNVKGDIVHIISLQEKQFIMFLDPEGEPMKFAFKPQKK